MMDGAIDIRLIVTLAGILVSVAGASAVGKMQIKSILYQLKDIESRIRDIDRRIDLLDTKSEKHDQRLHVLSSMSSPEVLRRDHMQLASALADIDYLKKETERLHKIHNGVHPPVSDIRKAT